jgi:hypothetical protein
MEGADQLRESIEATRSQVKALQRCARTTLQFLADLEERLDAADNAQPKEGTAHGNGHQTTRGRLRISA